MVKIRSLLDNLAIAISLIGVLPIYLYLDLPTRIIFPAALVLGAWCDRREKYFLAARIATIISLLVFVVYAIQIDKNNLVNPSLNIAVLLLAVRLLTEKEGRHFLQIFLLAGFALAGSSLMTLSLAFLPLMVLLVTGIIGGLVLLCFYSDDPRMALDRDGFYRLLRMSLFLPAGALFLAIFFFFIMPRTQHPLWDFLNPAGSVKVGFSEEVRPGAFSSTSTDETIAFRVEGPEMDPTELYWRVTVLDNLDGAIWKRSHQPTGVNPRVTSGEIINLKVFPATGQGNFLVTLDHPLSVHGVYNNRWTDGVFRFYRKSKRPQSYDVQATLSGKLLADDKTDPAIYLQIPSGVAPRTRQAARDLILANGTGRAEQIEVFKEFFRKRQLVYATDNLPLTNEPVDNFLFDSKRGYCEYFASAFAIMLREAGIPARLVGGYMGGSYNPLGNYYIVGERNAHVWIEALTEEGVWERIDPNLYAINAEGSLLARSRQQRPAWQQWADAIDYYWTQAVITFDFARQMEVAKSARDKIREWRREGFSLRDYSWFLIVPFVPVLVVLLWRHKRFSVEEKLMQNFTRIIRQQVGAEKIPPAIGLIEMARRSPGPHAREFARIYSGAVYRDRTLSQNEILRLNHLLKEMKKSPRQTPG